MQVDDSPVNIEHACTQAHTHTHTHTHAHTLSNTPEQLEWSCSCQEDQIAIGLK